VGEQDLELGEQDLELGEQDFELGEQRDFHGLGNVTHPDTAGPPMGQPSRTEGSAATTEGNAATPRCWTNGERPPLERLRRLAHGFLPLGV
jgi:hypothetical protein